MSQSKYIERMPWSASDGYFNGDMFYEWLSEPPLEDQYDSVYAYQYALKVWRLLNTWENSIREEAMENLADMARAKVASKNFRMKSERYNRRANKGKANLKGDN